MASILVNGSPTHEFSLDIEFLLSDPLSPFLFLIDDERLNIMMKTIVDTRFFKGYKVGRNKPIHIYHLQFADETLILGEKIQANVSDLKVVLILFDGILWVKVNFHKSMLVGVKFVDS